MPHKITETGLGKRVGSTARVGESVGTLEFGDKGFYIDLEKGGQYVLQDGDDINIVHQELRGTSRDAVKRYKIQL